MGHESISKKLEDVLGNLLDFVEPGPESEQAEKELSDIIGRYKRIVKSSTNRNKQIEELEPLAHDHHETIKPVEILNVDAENALAQKPKTTVNLDSLVSEVTRIKVGFCCLYYIEVSGQRQSSANSMMRPHRICCSKKCPLPLFP